MDPRDKINEKMEQKFKVGGATKTRLSTIFSDVSRKTEGFLTFDEWETAVKVGLGNALTDDECEGLFHFYLQQIDDPMVKQYQIVPIDLIIADLTGAQQQYGTLFNSGDEPVKANLKSRGNLPSQEGGIFGGGSYASDAKMELGAPRGGAPPPPTPPIASAAPAERQRGNQSSITGGIFGAAALQPPPSSRANRSNQSSIPGGIFGDAQPGAAPSQRARPNSNASSIPGGIFGSG